VRSDKLPLTGMCRLRERRHAMLRSSSNAPSTETARESRGSDGSGVEEVLLAMQAALDRGGGVVGGATLAIAPQTLRQAAISESSSSSEGSP
jgi:hypothetical protein